MGSQFVLQEDEELQQAVNGKSASVFEVEQPSSRGQHIKAGWQRGVRRPTVDVFIEEDKVARCVPASQRVRRALCAFSTLLWCAKHMGASCRHRSRAYMTAMRT